MRWGCNSVVLQETEGEESHPGQPAGSGVAPLLLQPASQLPLLSWPGSQAHLPLRSPGSQVRRGLRRWSLPLLWRLLLYIPPPPTRTFITKGKKPKSQMIKTCDGPGVSGASWLFFLDLSQPEYLDWWWLYNIQFLLKRAIRYLVPNFIINKMFKKKDVNKCYKSWLFRCYQQPSRRRSW